MSRWIKLGIAVMGALIVGALIGVGVASQITPLPTRGPVAPVPTSPAPSPRLSPIAEDDPGWDCRIDGFHDCVFDGQVWINVDHLPDDLRQTCVIVWNSILARRPGHKVNDIALMCREQWPD